MNGIARLDELIEELEASPDDEANRRVYRALETFLEVQRTAFVRVIDVLRAEGHSGVIQRFLEDPLLASILRAYRLVEPDLEEKVAAAVEALGRGDRVRLVGVQSGVARLEADADRETWKALKDEVDRAVRAAAPELVGVAVARRERSEETSSPPPLNLPVFTAGPVPAPAWLPLIHWWSLEQQARQKVELFEEELLVCGVEGRAYAFENRCPEGQEPLEQGALEGFLLTCPGHGLAFDLRTARCRERPELALVPRRTKVEEGIVRVEALRKPDVH
ncbi:MAG TPA: Rieske 2Fe-2S domain-containing protein [Thermoanaerobaculia bacterium]|nr:Rieske 2Fe-2S domain-containing protein [Thermoanaerobaculia bacterium]